MNKEDFNWNNMADNELNSSEWFGAIIRYFWHLGKREFKTFYNQKELKKNAFIGTLFKIFLFMIFLYILYLISV